MYYEGTLEKQHKRRIWILGWFSCAVFLLCLHNTLITTHFDVLKYIKKIFKMLVQYIFNAQQMTAPTKPVKNMDSTKKPSRESKFIKTWDKVDRILLILQCIPKNMEQAERERDLIAMFIFSRLNITKRATT